MKYKRLSYNQQELKIKVKGEIKMKNSCINVEFKDPAKEVREQLQRSGARNIDIRKNFNGELEIRYTLKCPDPEKEIARVLEGLGANIVRPSSTYNGARYDYRLNDIIDERDFKRKASDVLRRSGFRAN